MTPPAAGPGPSWLGDAGQVLLAVAMASLLPVAWASVVQGEIAAGWEVALIAALLTLHAAVATARRWPVPSYAVGGAAMLVLVAAPDLGGPTAVQAGSEYGPVLLPNSLCFFLLLYAVSARAGRPWPNAALGLALIGCLVTVARLWGFAAEPLAGWVWTLILGTAAVGGTVAAWALGRFRATRADWVDQLAERGAADERRRIAREMHDVVAHSLAVVVSHAEAGRLVVVKSPDRAGEILDTIAGTGRQALNEMRGLLGVLRDGDVPSDPQPGLAEIDSLVAGVQRAGLSVEYDASGLGAVPPGVALTAYRVVQEALTNVTRHAGPGATAVVRLRQTDDALVVSVSDDGRGVRGAAAPPGRGLTGMRERVEAGDGRLEAGPADRGWRVSARMPL